MDSSSSFVSYLIATGFDFFIKIKKNALFKTEYPHFHLVDAVRMLGVGRHLPHTFKIPLERLDKTPWQKFSSTITGTVPVNL